MIKRRGKIRTGVAMVASAVPSIWDFARGLWKTGERRRWLVPLVVFLCLTGVLLIVATSVEAIAPFIYSIF
jgi:hypothetical protein